MYDIPRNVKGEGRILFIFSTKGLIFTAIGAVLGLVFYALFSMLGLGFVGLISILIFGGIGFCIGTLKVPDTTAFEITKKTGGENMDDVIIRAFKFKMQKNKIYMYNKEEMNRETEENKDE